MTVQKITADLSQLEPSFDNMPAQRVETGALEINGDWPGVFVRGDNAFMYQIYLRQAIEELKKHQTETSDIFQIHALEELADLLASCIVHPQVS